MKVLFQRENIPPQIDRKQWCGNQWLCWLSMTKEVTVYDCALLPKSTHLTTIPGCQAKWYQCAS